VLQNEDVYAVNTELCPDNVKPKNNGNAAIIEGKLTANLSKFSWNVIGLGKKK
jgi:alpha-N-arabinofuranosidase